MSVMNPNDYVNKELNGREAAEFLLAVAKDADENGMVYALQSRAVADLLRALAAHLSFDAFAPMGPEPRVMAMRLANLMHQWVATDRTVSAATPRTVDVTAERKRLHDKVK